MFVKDLDLTVNRPEGKSLFRHEWLFSTISVSSMLILLGLIYLLYLPGNIFDDIFKFLKNFTFAQFHSSPISLPVPIKPGENLGLYNAAFEFCVGIAIIESVILALRLKYRSPHRRIAETTGNVVAWFGSSYMVLVYLLTATTTTKWFVFWAGIFIVIGLSLIARAFVGLAYRWKQQVEPSTPVPETPPATSL